MQISSPFLARLHHRLLRPLSDHPDVRRREFILSILVGGLCGAAFLTLVATLIHRFSTGILHDAASLAIVLLTFIVLVALFLLVRHGHSRPVGMVLIGLVAATAVYYLLTWSFELPIAELLFIFAIVLAGVLFAAYAAIIASTLATGLVVYAAYLQTHGSMHPNISWLGVKPDFADAIGDVAIFMLIGLVTWLANSEIDRSLARARASEASLAHERDSLEMKVKERTAELEKSHLVRLMELQRFAELGRLAAGLLHDVSSPLTAASLNLDQLQGQYKSDLVRQAAQSLQHIERYVIAARKQLVDGGTITTFSVKKELVQVVSILTHAARTREVAIAIEVPADLRLTGDAVKFSQVAANLILNAIEAYDDLPSADQPVVQVHAMSRATGVRVTVHDQGKGITEQEQPHIFESFYTTKANKDRNMGIGLSLVKQIVEQDFAGRLRVVSSTSDGTTFTSDLVNQKK